LNTAYLLVAHGSRDPRPQKALETLAQKLAPISKLSSPLILTATLECHPLPLHQQIQAIAMRLKSQSYECLRILPLFLGAGRHVQEDLPRELQLARGELPLEVLPTLGHNPQVQTILDHLFQKLAPQADAYRLLVAHGSRYPGGNEDFEVLARSLKATIAYWSVEPSLTQAIKTLELSPGKPLILQPYFLFAGGLTDALWSQVTALKQDQPQCPFYWGNPLSQSPLFAPLIAQILFL